jgi:hypothetical protein
MIKEESEQKCGRILSVQNVITTFKCAYEAPNARHHPPPHFNVHKDMLNGRRVYAVRRQIDCSHACIRILIMVNEDVPRV